MMRFKHLACLALTALLLTSTLTGCSAQEVRDRILLYLFSSSGQSTSVSSEVASPEPEVTPEPASSKVASPKPEVTPEPASSEVTSPKPEVTPDPTPTPDPFTRTVEDANAEISSLLAELDSLESSMTSQIDSCAASARSEYHALPAREQTYWNKLRIIMSYSGTLSSLESSCDAQVSDIVSKIRAALEDSGQSTALADQVWSSYNSKKSSAIASLRSSAGI
jgi:hypothetical protein